jgi:gamma-glutamyltranspeptidase/glutathione hydrolase
MAIVTAAHPIAARAGREILLQGGNAVDAAVAVSAALGVVEPFASGLGGGGFMMIAPRGDPAKLAILDGRGVTSELAAEDRFYPKGLPAPMLPRTGPMAPSIPGLGRMLALALREHGSGMPLDRILDPAIRAARDGFDAGPLYRYATAINEWALRANPEAARIFLRADRVVQTDMARTLSIVARDGFEALYAGEIGAAVLRAINATGSVWSARDLADYEVKRRVPLEARTRGCDVYTTPPPSRGGRGILLSLEKIERPDDPLHLADVFQEVLTHIDGEVGDPDRASPSTTHLTILDDAGTLVALTQTHTHFFGSGFVPPGTGLLLNDDLAEMSKTPGGPNSVRPRRRPISNMAPTMVFRDGRPILAMGSPGFYRIISAQTQMLLNLVHHRLSAADAVARPRVHGEDGKIFLEGHHAADVIEQVRRRATRPVVVRPRLDPFFGGIHAIHFGPDGPVGIADPRRDGVVERT